MLVASIEDVKSDADAKKILEQVKPDWVVWSAGTLPCPLPLIDQSTRKARMLQFEG